MIQRDRYGRPMVIPPDGGKPTAYTRCTTYVGALEDTYNLEKWKMRMTALGLTERPDLALSVAAFRDDKDKLNEICDQAVEAAKAGAAANTGTALHELTDQWDRGVLDIAKVPATHRPDIEAYRDVTRDLTITQIEQFGVHDGLKIGGTWDRIVQHKGKPYIADLKTGADLKYGMGKIAMQLAVYAHCRAYDPLTGTRTDIDVDQERAIIIHLPAGTGKAFLHRVDIAAGWEAVQVATQVRAWRARKNLSERFEYAKAPDPEPDADLMWQISTAVDVTELRALWATNNGTGKWTAAHTVAAKARQEKLRGA